MCVREQRGEAEVKGHVTQICTLPICKAWLVCFLILLPCLSLITPQARVKENQASPASGKCVLEHWWMVGDLWMSAGCPGHEGCRIAENRFGKYLETLPCPALLPVSWDYLISWINISLEDHVPHQYRAEWLVDNILLGQDIYIPGYTLYPP